MEWLSQTQRKKFDNGLTLLLYPLPDSGAAAFHVTVQAGYFCEQDSEVGLAHLLEHMYFKGSQKFPDPGTLGIRMKGLGGAINATTSYDQTCYFCEVPAENLPPSIELMSDAFLAPLFPADELERECEVVIEEFNRKLDSPSAYSLEQLIRLAYEQHRMKRWRIGTPEQLRSYRREHLFDYFHRTYQPQNMVVVVTGNFDPQQITDQIGNLLGTMKRGDLQKDFGPTEPAQHGLRYVMEQSTATQSFVHFGFHAPGVTHPDGPALDFLCFLLSAGKSSRLHRALVETRRSASSATCGYQAYEDIGMILMSAVSEAKTIRQAGHDLWSTVQDLLHNGISAEEMQKVKNKLKLQQVMQTEEAMSLAQLLGYHESYGGYEQIQQNMDALQALTPEAVVEAGSRCLKIENLNALEYINEKMDPLDPSAFESMLSSGVVPPELAMPPAAPPDESSAIGSSETPPSPIIHRGRATYILQPDPRIPFVSMGLFFRGGRNEEDATRAGITHFLHRMALKGTPSHTAEQLAFRFDRLGNPPFFGCYRDYCGFGFESLPELAMPMADLLIHCLSQCRFPENELETERGKVKAIIRRNADDNFVRPMQLFLQAYYGAHPYGLPEVGFENTASAFQQADLMAWKERIFNPRRMMILSVGNFDPETVIARLEHRLESFEPSQTPLKSPAAVSRPSKSLLAEDRPKKQTAFVLGFPAPDAANPDIHVYEVLQQILSGMGGRLFINLRSKRSLAYTVYAGVSSSLFSGTFLTYIAGEAAKEKLAIEGMWEELEKLKQEPVSEQEIINARNALIGGYAINTQSASSKLGDLLNNFLLDRPMPFLDEYKRRINAVKPEQVLETARKTFVRDFSTMGIVRGTTQLTEPEKRLQEEAENGLQ
jgi:zinc protease